MQGKPGDHRRTLSQKILSSHLYSTGDESFIEVQIDQVILAQAPLRTLPHALAEGLELSQVDVSVAYPPFCLAPSPSTQLSSYFIPPDWVNLGLLISRPGAGFSSVLHLERLSRPGQLALTDDPRLVNNGGAGMLVLPASDTQLSEALRTGKTCLLPPQSITIFLSGKLRSGVHVQDINLELIRRGLPELVQEVQSRSPVAVILEFVGPALQHLNVTERATLCALAPHVGAASALTISDEKTLSFLREQKRTKSHKVLSAEPGIPTEEYLEVSLSNLEPLLMDSERRVRPLRDRQGELVHQVLLGGDSACSLRDLLTVTSLLKGKRVPLHLELLFAPPSRQILDALARTDALRELIALGMRLVEPDRRFLNGQLHPPSGLTLRNSFPDLLPGASVYVASPESLAYAIAHGALGDPRRLKRSARLAFPQPLNTEDVLLARGLHETPSTRGRGRVDEQAVLSSRPRPTHTQPLSTASSRPPASLTAPLSPEDQEIAPTLRTIGPA